MQPPVIYHLSNRQRKELLVRGVRLRIALPVPPHDVDDPLDWARSVLASDVRDLAVQADECELAVAAIRSPGDTLTSHLGAIVSEDDDRLIQYVAAIVVTLEPANPRHDAHSVQWPASVDYRGERLP